MHMHAIYTHIYIYRFLVALHLHVPMGPGKRFRSLPSVLWESDEEDGASLHQSWYRMQAGSTCVCRTALAVEKERCKELERDIQMLRLVITDLQEKLKPGGLPSLQRLVVVKKPAATTALRRGNPWYWLATLPQHLGNLPRLQDEIIPDLQNTGFGSSRITFDVFEWKLASDLLDECVLSIQSLSSSVDGNEGISCVTRPPERWAR